MWDDTDDNGQRTSGGFLNDSSDNASPDKNAAKRGQTIIPVMIGHLTQCKGELNLWGLPARIVTFIGIIRHIKQSTTKLTYDIEDDTDKITVLEWRIPEKDNIKPLFKLKTYVRVYGYLREQSDVKHVLTVKMLPLTDLNELTNHLLEVTYATLKAERMKNIKNECSVNANPNDIVMSDDSLVGLTKEQSIIFKIIQAENDSENGIERNILKSRVPKNVLSKVDEIIDFLTSEGHIYSTLTDDHFKTT